MSSGLRKIKLVCLVGHLGLGGSERQLYLFLKNLDRKLFESHVVVFNSSPYIVLNDSLGGVGVKVWSVPQNCKSIIQRVVFIYATLRRLAPHVVHSWTVHDNPYAGLVGWAAKVPVRIGSLRGSVNLPGFQSLTPLLRWLSLHSVGTLVVNSKAILQELYMRGYPSERVFVLPNCVEPCSSGRVDCDLSTIGIGNRHRLVGIVGNLRSVKNHTMFIEAMAKVLPHFSDVKALIVGQPTPKEPDLYAQLQSRVRQLGLEGRIVLAGFRSDIPDLLQRMTVFCLTSTSEGMPNVVLEAMAEARPVVATKVGGIAELIEEGVNGLLVESGDVDGLSCKVKELLSNPALGEKMGRAGREMVKRDYSCDRAVQRLTKLYLNTLEQKGFFFTWNQEARTA